MTRAARALAAPGSKTPAPLVRRSRSRRFNVSVMISCAPDVLLDRVQYGWFAPDLPRLGPHGETAMSRCDRVAGGVTGCFSVFFLPLLSHLEPINRRIP